MTNVVTGHRQTFGTSSDVLAQQFATQVERTFICFRALALVGTMCDGTHLVDKGYDDSYCSVAVP